MEKLKTPEEIVAMIGNIANRSDIKEVQDEQVKLIKALIQKERDECIEVSAGIYKAWKESENSEQGAIACSQIWYYLTKRNEWQKID